MPMQNPAVMHERELRPIGDKIMVRPIKPESVTKGGIIIPQTAKRPPRMGIVMAAGPGRHIENSTPTWLIHSTHVTWLLLNRISTKIMGGIHLPPEIPNPIDFIPNPVKATKSYSTDSAATKSPTPTIIP